MLDLRKNHSRRELHSSRVEPLRGSSQRCSHSQDPDSENTSAAYHVQCAASAQRREKSPREGRCSTYAGSAAKPMIQRVWERAQLNLNRPCSESAVEDWSSAELGHCRVEAVTLPLQWRDPDAVLALLHAERTR